MLLYRRYQQCFICRSYLIISTSKKISSIIRLKMLLILFHKKSTPDIFTLFWKQILFYVTFQILIYLTCIKASLLLHLLLRNVHHFGFGPLKCLYLISLNLETFPLHISFSNGKCLTVSQIFDFG